MVKEKRKRKTKVIPANDTWYRIYKSDKTLYRDETGNFKQFNQYYFDTTETTFTKTRIIIVAFLIFIYWAVFTLFYSLCFEIPYWKAIFEFADNYVFLGGITLILFFAFKRKKVYNINKEE